MARRAMLSYPHETSLHLYKPADITVEKVYLHINFWTEDIFRVVFSKDIIKRYCNLTGFAKLPPLWSFGLWMSRNSYVSWDVVDDIAKKSVKTIFLVMFCTLMLRGLIEIGTAI